MREGKSLKSYTKNERKRKEKGEENKGKAN